MPVFEPRKLNKIVTAIFIAAGTPETKAKEVTKLLIEANLAGHDSHGVIRVPQYLDSMARGEIEPEAEIGLVRDRKSTAVIDGHWDFGQVTMNHAVRLVIEKATAHGLGAVAVRNANHIGRLGSYVDLIARQNMIGILYVNTVGTPWCRMAPWGGIESRLGTNPVAKGIPTSSGEPIVIDMTTTVVAEGKVRLKRNSGESAPSGWLLDSNGIPTNDPMVLYEEPRGSIQPLGGIVAGHKGYALNIAIELLAGALTGNGCAGGEVEQLSNGIMVLAIDVTEFRPLEEFFAETDRFISFVKSSDTVTGVEEVLIPGEIEAKKRKDRLRHGIVVDDGTWQQISDHSGRLGLTI